MTESKTLFLYILALKTTFGIKRFFFFSMWSIAADEKSSEGRMFVVGWDGAGREEVMVLEL